MSNAVTSKYHYYSHLRLINFPEIQSTRACTPAIYCHSHHIASSCSLLRLSALLFLNAHKAAPSQS